MFTKLTRRVLTGVVAVGGLTAVLAAPASAAPAASAGTNATSAVSCRNVPGNYCRVLTSVSVSGGVRLKAAHSTGYTTAAGHGREFVVYTCTGPTGLCAIAGTNNVNWGGRDVKLVAQHTGLNLFLPCGAKVDTAWLINTRPKTLAPGHPGGNTLKFTVVCHASQNSVALAS